MAICYRFEAFDVRDHGEPKTLRKRQIQLVSVPDGYRIELMAGPIGSTKAETFGPQDLIAAILRFNDYMTSARLQYDIWSQVYHPQAGVNPLLNSDTSMQDWAKHVRFQLREFQPQDKAQPVETPDPASESPAVSEPAPVMLDHRVSIHHPCGRLAGELRAQYLKDREVYEFALTLEGDLSRCVTFTSRSFEAFQEFAGLQAEELTKLGLRPFYELNRS